MNPPALPYLIPAIVLIVGILYLIRACMIAYEEGCTERLKAEAMSAPFWWETESAPEYLPSERRYTVTRVVDPKLSEEGHYEIGPGGKIIRVEHA
jgi:hypothetical protein